MMGSMIIRNVRLIDPETMMDEVTDIAICDGIVTGISQGIEAIEAQIIDGTNLVAAPGLVDAHVHFRDPGFEYKEDIYTGARAAAKGGFTSVIMMANTKPAIDNIQTLDYVINKGRKTPINVYACGNITDGCKGENITDMKLLHQNGAVGFTDDGIPLKESEIVMKAMQQAARINVPLSFHEENPELITNNGINAGKASEYYGIGGSPRESEISLIERDIKIAEDIPADIVIQHISSSEGVELVRRARKTNKHVHAEVCPHHFTLTEEAAIKYGTLAKMNPPLRTEHDRQELIKGLQDGTIEIISTDHAPHSAEEKNRPITEAPSGIIGLETSFGLGIRELVNPGYISLMDLIRVMSTNPARLYGLPAGRIAVGCPADIVIFDPTESWTVSENFESKSSNSPFVGEKLCGRIHMTICRGNIAYQI